VEYGEYVRKYWLNKLGSQDGLDKALQDGVIESALAAASAPYNAGALAGAVTAIAGTKKGGKAELVLYPKVSLGNGKYANNPWLQELPDPITKLTWDNYACLSLRDATQLKVREGQFVVLTVGQEKIEVPAHIQPGQAGTYSG